MDLITDLPCTENGNDSIWVVVDRLSKMVHIVALQKTCTAEDVAVAYELRRSLITLQKSCALRF